MSPESGGLRGRPAPPLGQRRDPLLLRLLRSLSLQYRRRGVANLCRQLVFRIEVRKRPQYRNGILRLHRSIIDVAQQKQSVGILRLRSHVPTQTLQVSLKRRKIRVDATKIDRSGDQLGLKFQSPAHPKSGQVVIAHRHLRQTVEESGYFIAIVCQHGCNIVPSRRLIVSGVKSTVTPIDKAKFVLGLAHLPALFVVTRWVELVAVHSGGCAARRNAQRCRIVAVEIAGIGSFNGRVVVDHRGTRIVGTRNRKGIVVIALTRVVGVRAVIDVSKSEPAAPSITAIPVVKITVEIFSSIPTAAEMIHRDTKVVDRGTEVVDRRTEVINAGLQADQPT